MSQDQILANILSFVETLPNKNEIKDQLNSSTMSVIYQLLAGMGVFSQYKYNQMRRETYLSTATKSSSIQLISKQLGYNISRANAPAISMIYQAIPTIVLKSGDVIGKYKDSDIVYFGATRFIEKGDRVTAYLGDYQTKTGTVQDINAELVVEVSPISKKSVDNTLLSFTSKGSQYDISKDLERYVILRVVADFSNNSTSTSLYIRDTEFGYGLTDLSDGDTYEIAWIESDGYNPSLSISNINGASDVWLPYEVLSYGSDPELDSKVQRLAPFYYSTMRRAVTEQDYTYLCKAHSYIRDCYAQTESGTKGKWQMVAKTGASIVEGTSYQIQIQPNTAYRYQAKSGDTLDVVLDSIIKRCNEGGWISVTRTGQVLTITATSAREDITPVGSTGIFGVATEITAHVVPPCCTIDIFYILSGQTRTGEVLSMTEYEQLQYAKYLETFKMAGKTMVLSPAKKVEKTISLKIGVKDRTLIDDSGVSVADYIKTKAREIVESNYEFQLNKEFNYAEMIASITKITMTKDFNEVQPITSCEANQGVFNLEALPDTYYVFPDIEITFED